VERTITMTCVSNEVGGTYVSAANIVGVDLADLLEEAGVRCRSSTVFRRGWRFPGCTDMCRPRNG
jgi:hypothetical protein